MNIGKVVRPKENAAFMHEVQLEWYVKGGEKNLSLATNYMFAKETAGNRKSPIDILYRLRQAYIAETFENRFVVIATYGHGKSHLAVALANYFGKPVESSEFEAVAGSIEHAFDGQSEAKSYRDFRQSRKKMLVVCLQGDKLVDLQQAFWKALETALAEHKETAEVRLPGWTGEASRLLTDIQQSKEEAERANEFLGSRESDLPSLLAKVEEYDGDVYDTVRSVVEHVKGVKVCGQILWRA